MGTSIDTQPIREEGTILKALYEPGRDNRENLCALEKIHLEHQVVDALILQSRSVACLMNKSNLEKQPNGTYRFRQNIMTLAEKVPYLIDLRDTPTDPNLPFKDEPAPGRGTGFLVRKNLFATAGHCVCKRGTEELDLDWIKKMRIVFDFHINDKGICQQEFSKIYKIDLNREIAWKMGTSDWALFHLTKDVEDRKPLMIEEKKTQLKSKDAVYMLGHPSGLPLKYTHSGKIKDVTHREFFTAQLDAFAGNSGSPIFDAITHKVIGILVNGQPDYSLDAKKQIITAHHVTQVEIKEKGYEGCQRISSINELIEAMDKNTINLSRLLQSAFHTVPKPIVSARPNSIPSSKPAAISELQEEIDFEDESDVSLYHSVAEPATSSTIICHSLERTMSASIRESKRTSKKTFNSRTTISSLISGFIIR